MNRFWINIQDAPFFPRRIVAAAAALGMDRYWGAFARSAASGRSGVVAGGEMA